ncbi:MAG: hypothetical protein U0M06_07530 [Clostridia bacterium]|nr:hypothetical protein [Clostridia bacterium]
MKDKLIKAIRKVPIADKTYPEYVEALADKLIGEGVFVPCKIGECEGTTDYAIKVTTTEVRFVKADNHDEALDKARLGDCVYTKLIGYSYEDVEVE